MILRTLNAIMIVLFGLSIAVQYNDPDALLWMAIYAYAFVMTTMAFFNRYTILAPLGMIAYLIGWAVNMPTWNPAEIAHLLSQPKMSTNDVEVAREALGLLICGGWMAVLAVVWWRRKAAGGAAIGDS
ncbi:MAG: transmembrane 220 family protein [Candidatus Hydrogenedentes bacterium]|nr:transmembrane 220 family protein [Candidatus Hydrogenedentota bacterium]